MNIREIALGILLDIEQGKKSHIALAEADRRWPDMSDRDRRFLRKLIHGTLEERLLLDHRLNLKSSVPVSRMKPLIRQVCRMSAYQIFFLDKTPDSAVINEAVKLVKKARMQGLAGFVNAVLRSVAREDNWPEESEEIRTGIPAWILSKWKKEQGPEACIRMAAAFRETDRVSFRLNRRLASPEELSGSLVHDEAEASRAPFPEGAYYFSSVSDISGLSAWRKGWIQIQDISSMLVGTAACPANGAMVLDLCAAPGGKSIHIADIMKGSGTIISCDLTEEKAEKIRENVRRTGFSDIEVKINDARVFVPEWEEAFDLVLADLPCSGLGVIGRKPEIRFLISQAEIMKLQALQREILKNAVRYVKPGGTLIYSTCTITAEENTANQSWIHENLGLNPVSMEDVLPGPLAAEPSVRDGYIQLLPGVHPCDGFFLAKYQKRMD